MPRAVATADPAAARQRAARGDWWLLDRLALAWSAGAAVLLFALIGRGNWYADDFFTFGQTRQQGLNPHYLEMTVFGHPQPGVRLLDWLLYRFTSMSYPLAAALECLAFGAMCWLVYRTLRLAFQPSPWHLVLTGMVSTTGLWVPVTAWWAAGSEMGATAGANTLTVYALLRCHRGPDRLLWGVLTGGALAAGLACYERALFGGMFAAWFVPAVTCRSLRPREVLAVLRRAWSGYLAMLVVAVGYLAVYLAHHLGQRHPGYTRAQLAHYLWVSWSHTLIPGLFGGSLRTGPNVAESYADPPLWWLVCCQLALLALVGYGLLRNRLRAALAWLVFTVLFLVGQYLIASARLAIYGVGIGDEFRYVADLLPLLALTVGITLLRPAALAQPAEPGQGRRAVGRRQLVATGAVLTALCTAYLITALPVSHRWTHARNVRYVTNLRAGVGRLDHRGPWSLYTTYAPSDVVLPSGGTYSQTPAIAALLTGHPVSADDLSRPMYLVDADGRLRPAALRTLATAPDACTSQPARQLVLGLTQPLPGNLWNVRLDYRVPAPTVLRFAVDPGTGRPIEATGSDRGFPVSGTGQLTFAVRYTAISALRLDAPVAGSCVSGVRIGRPVPTGPAA